MALGVGLGGRPRGKTRGRPRGKPRGKPRGEPWIVSLGRGRPMGLDSCLS